MVIAPYIGPSPGPLEEVGRISREAVPLRLSHPTSEALSTMFRSPIVDAIVVLVIALLILGPKRLPGLGKGLGQGMREFKEGITGEGGEQEKPGLTQATPMPEPQPSQERPAAHAPDSGSQHSA
jgi:sec-independent protein translocase protein TatA